MCFEDLSSFKSFRVLKFKPIPKDKECFVIFNSFLITRECAGKKKARQVKERKENRRKKRKQRKEEKKREARVHSLTKKKNKAQHG